MLMGEGAAICWATKIAEAGAEDALGKQIANNQPQCLLQLSGSSKQLMSLSKKRWMKHIFAWLWSSQHQNMCGFVTTL